MNNEQAFSGISNLYENFDLDKIAQKKIFLIGIGGVGSWCAEALIRSGVKNLTLMDLDEICISNTNRQVHTNLMTIGESKVSAMKKRLELIADDCEINIINDFLTSDNVEKLGLLDSDLVIDAFDSLDSKASLAAYCLENHQPLLVCGAAGGKPDATKVDFAPLNQTENDRLLKHLKRRLRYRFHIDEERFKTITAVFSRQRAIHARDCDLDEYYLKQNCQGSLGSSMMVTASIGLLAAQLALEKILE